MMTLICCEENSGRRETAVARSGEQSLAYGADNYQEDRVDEPDSRYARH